MLVLSRRLGEKLLFPGFHTSVQVVDIKRGTVRLGIQAPRNVTILRDEIPDRSAERGAAGPAASADVRQLLVNGLDRTAKGLAQAQRLLQAGQVQEAMCLVAGMREDCRMLQARCTSPAGNGSAAPGRKPCKALVVEDNRNERELLAGLLRLSGVDVATAGDGADALGYLRSHDKPDVILLDMGLPKVDGPTMVREIRHDPALAGLRIFGVSGHLPQEFDLEQGPRGIDRWFHKPVDPVMLIHELGGPVGGR